MREEIATDEEAKSAVRVLLRYIREDPDREGLLETPERVVRAWDEMTCGYGQDPAQILSAVFDGSSYDQIVACPCVEFYSMCEHHLLPFFGLAHIGYLPARKNPRIVGLSKMARLVDCFARRLQIQERMTIQIADAMERYLHPRGVAVIVQAKHLCMACRGVQKHRAVMVTSAMRGVFRHDGARAEFMRLVDLASQDHG